MGTELATRPGWLTVRRKTDIVGEVIGAFESETAAVLLQTAPRREHITVWVLVGFVALSVLLCCVVKIDIVVVGSGTVSPTKGVLYVSPFTTGIVKAVNVRAGDVVKKGQALATLDPTFTQADLTQLREHLASDEAVVAREEAEMAKRPYVWSTADKHQAVQGEAWLKRQAEYKSNVASFDSQIHSAEAQMTQAMSDATKYKDRLKLATDAEAVYAPLLDKGYVSKLQVMQATDTKTEMNRLLLDAENQITQYRATAGSLRAQRDAYIHTWYANLATQLTSDQNDLDLTRDSLTKGAKLQELTSLDSPEDAIVVKVGKLSPGSVYTGGGVDATSPGTDPLFTLMPVNAPLFVDLEIQSTDVGFVRVGQPVRMKLDAYRYLEYGVASGIVKGVSENSFTLDDNNQPTMPYYKVHVAITDVNLRGVPKDFRLIPGNTLRGDIMVGKRTIMSYLSDAILNQTSQAMREP
jgi:HlyD family type I secretion membrane fusion protein